MENWLINKKVYLLAALTAALSVLAMTQGWIDAQTGVGGLLAAAGAAAMRAAITKVQERIDTPPPAGGAK